MSQILAIPLLAEVLCQNTQLLPEESTLISSGPFVGQGLCQEFEYVHILTPLTVNTILQNSYDYPILPVRKTELGKVK